MVVGGVVFGEVLYLLSYCFLDELIMVGDVVCGLVEDVIVDFEFGRFWEVLFGSG